MRINGYQATLSQPRKWIAVALLVSQILQVGLIFPGGDILNDCCKSKDGIAKIGDCCVDIHQELEAAKLETDKLMKHLKVEPLPTPKKDAAKK